MWVAHSSLSQGFSGAQQEHALQLQKVLVDGSGAIKGHRNHYTDFYELHPTTKASTKLCGAPHNSHSLSGSMVQFSSFLEAKISSRGRQAIGEAALLCPGFLPAASGELPQLCGQGASILAQTLQLMNRTWSTPGKSLFLFTDGSVIFGSYSKTWKSGGMNSDNLYLHAALQWGWYRIKPGLTQPVGLTKPDKNQPTKHLRNTERFYLKSGVLQPFDSSRTDLVLSKTLQWTLPSYLITHSVILHTLFSFVDVHSSPYFSTNVFICCYKIKVSHIVNKNILCMMQMFPRVPQNEF